MRPIARRSLAQKTAVGDSEVKSSSVAARPDAASIASTSISIKSRCGSSPASVSAATRPTRRSSHCGIDSDPLTSAIRAVAQPQKMLAREPAAEDVVDDGGRDVARRAAMVEEHERDAAVGQPLEIALVLTGRIDDDPADTLTRERVERAQKPEKPPPSERHT